MIFMKTYIQLLLFFILSVSTLHSLDLNYASGNFEKFDIEYFIDEDSTMRYVDIKNANFSPISNKHGFNGEVGVLWYKIVLNNMTNLDKDLFLHDNLAYFSKSISIYEQRNKILTNQYLYNIFEDESSNKLIGSTLIHPLHIQANSTLTLFIKNTAMISSIVDFRIFDNKSSMQSLTNKTFFSNIIIAILLSLAAYNIMFFFFNKQREFLYYALYLTNASFGLMYMYGSVFNNFHLYGELTHYFNITMISVPFFLVLFLKALFDVKEINQTLNKFLTSIIYITYANILIALLYDLPLAVDIAKLTFIYSFILVFNFSYCLYKSNHDMKHIFFAAYLTYTVGMLVTILALNNGIDLNFFTLHASGLGLVIEAILFSYLINNHIKLLENEINKQKEIIISKNKKAQLGEMITAITHQWKQPISAIGSITTLLDFRLKNNTILDKEELKEKVAQINSNILFLSETIDDFKDFFNPRITLVKHNLEEIINRAVSLFEDDTLTKEITIKQDLNFVNELEVHKHELLHILLNIIQNSKEAFKDSKEEIKLIKIIGYNVNNKTYIDIIDNAGGISQDTLPHIFNEYYTTKEKKSGSGLGLYLSKFILEDHLKGSIEVKNIDGGAMFRIIL